jgi:tetratricopeptide (TPR) repeat protein
LGEITTTSKSILAVIALIVLCTPAFGQTTAEEWFNEGLALQDQGKYDESIQDYDKAIEINPNATGTWYNKGVALVGLGKYNEANQAYDKIIKIEPKNAAALARYAKGVVLVGLGKYNEANQAFNESHRDGADPSQRMV